MNIQYHKWLEIKVLNDYFTEGVCTVLKLVPFTETAKKLKNYNTLLRKQNNLFSLYTGTSQSELDPQTEFTNLGNLYFQVEVEDPLFFNYTVLPLVPQGQLLFFENSINGTPPENDNSIFDAKSVPVKQGNLFDQAPDDEAEILIINDESGFTVQWRPGSENRDPDPHHGIPPINLNRLPTGRYEIRINNNKPGELFYHFDNELSDNCLGVLKIDMKVIPDVIKDSLPLALALQFKVRQVYFKYQIIVPELWDAEKTKIEVMEDVGTTKEVEALVIEVEKKLAHIQNEVAEIDAAFSKTGIHENEVEDQQNNDVVPQLNNDDKIAEFEQNVKDFNTKVTELRSELDDFPITENEHSHEELEHMIDNVAQMIHDVSGTVELLKQKVEIVNYKRYLALPDATIVGGQNSKVFISPSPTALKQKLIQHPYLEATYSDARTSGTNTFVMEQLPNPGAERLENYKTADGDAICATTIVYV